MAITNNLTADNSTVTWTDGAYINPNTGQSEPLNGYSHTDSITVEPDQDYTLKIGGYGVAWYDASGTFISVSGNSSAQSTMRTITSPANAATCIAIYLTSKKNEFRMFKGNDFYYKDQVDGLDMYSSDKYWANKKIAWYGTSIPAGFPNQSNQWEYGYPDIASRLLGADIQNYCIAGGTIRQADTNGSPVNPPQSFTNVASVTSTNYLGKMVNLIGTELEPDLFVIDYGVNDYSLDQSDIDNVAGYDFTSEDTNTFLGSYNKTLKELFTAKPTAKVMLVTHFSDDRHVLGSATKDYWKTLNDLIVKIGEYWNIPVLDLRKISGMRSANGIDNLNIYCPDGSNPIHPATDTEKKAINYIARLAAQFILNNIPTDIEVQQTVVPPPPPPPPNPTPTGSVLRSTATLMKTSADTFIQNDDGIDQFGRETDFLTLDDVPVHNDGSATINTTTNRFTDDLGGQDYVSGIRLDWSTWDGTTLLGWQGDFMLSPSYQPLDTVIDFCNNFTLAGFSGWHCPNFTELSSVAMKRYNCFNYPPFDYTGVNLLWTSTTLSNTIANSLRLDTFDFQHRDLNSDAGRPFPCRYFELSTSNVLT